ncbi:MAG: carboxypeptidase-like regulatory domain-containing protein [Candidatus Poribacteria bacterium]|nr:carboxypeptidase-like regulatory domain-containing protein [Candidatus Poribacteria bacterium]
MQLKKRKRYSYILITVACICMSTSIVFSEENAANGGTIQGKITDQNPQQSTIEGVKVNIIASDNKKYTVTTDTNGEYKIENLPAGLYTVFTDKQGYLPAFRKSVVVVDAEKTFVDLKMSNWIDNAKQTATHRTVLLLHNIIEIMSKRHNLDKTVVDALHRSIRESIDTAMKHDTKLSKFLINSYESNLDILERLWSQPEIKEIFTKHLSDAQLQDYNDFINTSRLEKQSIINLLIILLDQEVFLTADQRKSIAQLLHGKTDQLQLTLKYIMTLDSQEAIERISQRLVIPLNDVLTKTQMKLWHTMVDMNPNNKKKQHLQVFFDRTEANLKRTVNAGRMTEKEAAAQLDTLKKQLGLEPKSEKLTPQEYLKQFLETKLAAHIEMLAIQNKHASERLTLATQGVVQQYLETKDRMAMYRKEEAKISEALWTQEITPEQADKQLGELTEKLWGENIEYEETGEPYAVDIINHPLYQKAIKDVLSDDAYTQYIALQKERNSFHQQVYRDAAITYIDTQLILNDIQRKQVRTIASNLTVQTTGKDAPMDMFYQLYQRIDNDMLSPWQHKQFELIFGPGQ